MLITVDTQSLTSQFDISKNQIDQLIDSVVKSITASYAEKLERQAKENLHQTRNNYIRNIKVLDEGRMKGAILLDYSKNPIVRMIEEGASAFDEKEGFEKSSKRHMKKDGGWYLTIPFREATTDAIGESDIFNGGILPEEVYETLKEKTADIPTSSGGLKSAGLQLGEIPEQYQLPKVRKEVTNLETNQKFEEYTNKTSIFAGISKMQDSVTGQNIYMSFRRVSDKSDDNSWIYSGLQARNLMDKAMNDLNSHLDVELNSATNQALTNLGF